jgi:hypothetical protein
MKDGSGNMRLTEILVNECTRWDEDALSSSYRMSCADVCLCNDTHMDPVSLSLKFRTCLGTRQDVIDYTLRQVDVRNCRRGGERRL